jgi:TIR domain
MALESMKIFYSYAHEDEHLRKKLETHLGLLQQQGLITAWHDRRISAGKEWMNEISSHLDTAQIILLLISSSFLASKYCYGSEMMQALERHNAGVARVIPIILRPVDWRDAPFSKLQALPTDGKPVTGRGWHNRDEAFADVAQGIRKVVEELRTQRSDIPPLTQLYSPNEHKEPLLSSNIVLIDASLDPHDSPYEQIVEEGRKIIRFARPSPEKGSL